MFRDEVEHFGDLRHVAAGFFDSRDIWNFAQASERCGFEIGAGAAGNVVENEGLVDGLGDGAEMPVLALLRGLVVIRRGGEDGVHTGARRDFFGFGYSLLRGVGSGAGYDWNASGNDFDGDV